MKLLLVMGMLSFSSFGSDYFAELRIGLIDAYKKNVDRRVGSDLSGEFKSNNFGVRLGLKKEKLSYFLEFNPEQEVEVKSLNELANVQSIYAGARYYVNSNLYLGGVLGHLTYELERGPNGITFAENPETSGLTYGIIAGYEHKLSEKFYVSGDALYAFGSIDDAGPSVTNVETIGVDNHYRLNVSVGYRF